MRQGARREGALPGRGALQGLRLLLDRLRPRRAQEAAAKDGDGSSSTKTEPSSADSGRRPARPALAREERRAPQTAADYRALATSRPRSRRRRAGRAAAAAAPSGRRTSRSRRSSPRRRGSPTRRRSTTARRRAGSGAPRLAFGAEPAPSRAAAAPRRERSVVSGSTRSSPMNGSRTNVPTLVELVRHRLRRPPAAARRASGRSRPGRAGSRGCASRSSARRPSIFCLPLLEAPALPLLAARLGRVRAVEAVREDRLRHVDVDPAERVDHASRKSSKSTIATWFDLQPRQRADRPQRERRPAELEGGVDLVRAEAGDRRRAGRAGSRGRRAGAGSGSVRTSRIESERRASARAAVRSPSVPSSRISVGFEISSPSCGASAASTRLRQARRSRRRRRSGTRSSSRRPRRRASTHEQAIASPIRRPQRGAPRRRAASRGAPCRRCCRTPLRAAVTSGTLPFVRPPL